MAFIVAAVGVGAWRSDVYWRSHRPIPAGPPPPATPKVTHADFIGSAACAACHQKQYREWRSSTHGNAGGAPDSVTLLRPFDGRAMRFKDAVVTPTVDASGAHVFRVAQNGKPIQVLRVAGVVGGGFMNGGGTQGFFTALPDGSLRFLPFDFSHAEERWFCNTGGRLNQGWVPITPALTLSDCADWPPVRIMGSLAGAQNCQQCHGSQITITPDTARQRYETAYTTLRVNCESCHGPGRAHVTRMREGKAASGDVGMRALGTLPVDSSLQVCFQCHSLKQELQPGYLPGDPFDQYWSILIPTLIGAPYFPDGRVRTFAYQMDHLASACYFDGGMSCTDCHDPHTQTYRDINGLALKGRFDDGQCLDCHASMGQPAEAHTHHRPGSAGSRCTSCHMPYLQQPSVGKFVRYGRSDHTISIPRPTLDGRFGIVGACQQCHARMPADTMMARIRQWWGRIEPLSEPVAGLLAAGGNRDPAAVARLVLHPDARNRLAQFEGLSHFFIHYVRPNMDSLPAVAVTRLEQMATSPDDDIAAMSLATLHLALGAHPAVRDFLIKTVRGLGTRDRAVRLRWVMIYKIRGRADRVTGDTRGVEVVRRKLAEIDPTASF